jgi:hypothetical protein
MSTRKVNLSYAFHMTSNDKRDGLACEILDEYNEHNADGCVYVRCTQHNRQSARCRIARYAQSTPMCILDAQATDCAPRLCVHSQPPVLYDQRADAGMKQYEIVQDRCAERGAKEERRRAMWAAEIVKKNQPVGYRPVVVVYGEPIKPITRLQWR